MSTLSRLSLLLFSLTVFIATTRTKEVRIVCYYTNWSVYRPGTAKFSPQNINPYLCTHLVYAFGGFTKENTLKPFDKYQDIEKGGYAKFTGLKTYNKNLKTLLAIGGWNEGSSRFSPMVANPERRKELVKNVIKFLRQNHFDGLDLDWEYPSFRDGGKPRDKENYALLVQELREEFERESEKTGRTRLLLTMAVPAGIEYINKGYDVPKLTKYLDWMNILSYDYHSAFEPAVNHHAPLYPLEEVSEYNYDGELNIDYTIKHYLEKGADPSKLVLGIPTYGRSYTLYNPEANEIGAPADGPGDMGEATRENGYLAYYEICDYVKNNGWKVENPNSDAMGPYAYKDNQWVSYDDEDVVRKKSEYVAEKELGGIMFWSIDNDDFRGNCHGKPYPLIEAGKEALLAALGVTEDNAISEQPKPIKAKTRQRNKSSTPVKETTTERNRNSSGAQAIRTRSRLKIKKQEEQSETRNKVTIKKDKLQTRRKETTTTRRPEASTGSSLVVTPGYSTPPPPTTPDPGSDFKCEDEGFFPHPRDCKKYFWCLSSGPSDLGIVAHQFTCPSGLYFNKAADSCDYTQNVLCRKKTTTTTTTAATTTATTTTTVRSAFSTPKPLPKITAATSRTTFSTTTASPEEEYEEYEYEDEEESVTDDKKGISEEDPKVIKELLDLIKRAGGIEELEKQLKIHEDGTASISGSGSTTQSSISKSLYERVLSRGAARFKDNKQTKPSYTTLNRNSRGPQADGLDKSEESSSKSSRERLQYTSIARQRATTAKAIVDDVEEEVEESVEDTSSQRSLRKPSNQPEYVTIRRQRPTTTTEAEILTRNIAEVNSKLGEISTQAPEYVTIRRQRPSTEKSSTSKYVTISRGTTTVSQATEDEAEETTLQTTKSQTTSTESTTNTNDIKFSTKTSVTETSSSSNSNVPNLVSSSSTDTTDKTVKANEAQTESSKVTPHLFDPRPFSFTARKKPTTTSSEITTTPIPKVSETTTTKTRLRQNPSPVNKLSTETSPEELDKLSQRSQSRFKHRNRIRSYSATDIKEDQNQSTKLPPQRVRNPNRLHFTPPTTEPYQDTYTQVRLFRPDVAAEISDLSSLTAVDFNAVRKDLPSTSRPIARRGRPRTSTTTQASVESNQNRTNSIPQSNRRAFRVRQNATAVFERPQVNGTSESAFRVRKVHRLQIESTTARAINFSEETRTLNRGRKIIRRLKPLSQRTSTTTTTTTLAPTTIFETIEDSTKDNLISATEAESDEREDILKSNEEGENIKLSESNIKENSDTSGIRNSNVLASEEKYQNSDELSKGASTPEDNVGSSSFETKSSTEPNIIVRTRKIIRKFQRPTVPQTTSTQPTSSESSTESSLSFSTESEFKKSFGRTRKVVRRFRPTSTFKPTSAETEISSKEGVIQSNLRNKKPYFVRRKPTFTTEVANKTEFAPPKRVSYPTQLRRRLPGSLTSSTSQATEATPVSSVASESSFSEEAPNTTASEATTQKLEVAFGLKVSEEATTVEDDVSATTIEITASSAVTESTSASTTTTTVQTSSTRSRGKYSPNRLNKFNTAAPRRRFTLRSSSTTTTVATTKLEPSTEKVVETTVAEKEQTVVTSERDSETITQLSNDEITTIPSIGDKNADDFPTSYATTPIEETSESFTDTLETNFSSSEISTTTEAPEDFTTVQVTTLTTEEPDVKTTEHISSTSTTSTTTTTTEGGFITRRPHRIFAPAKSRPKFAPHLPTTEVSTSTTERVPAYKVNKNIFSTRKPYVPKASQTPSLIDILTKSSTEAPRKHFVPHKQKDEDFEELPADEPVVDEDDVEVEEDDDEVKVNNRENSQKSKVAGKDKTVIIDSQENRHLRNQKLYSHPRKMNIPHPGPVTPSPSTTEALDSQITTGTPEIPTETTESSLTTLHHVFAITESLEAENSSEATTLATNKTSQKIVEISRIVEVSAKEEKVNPNKNDVVESKTTLEVVPVQNKLGEITRVTEIKVVDGSNKTTSENEITDEKAERKDRKFQLYGGIKIDNEISNKYKQNTIEIIDSKSHVKKITPKPAFAVEATTLPLEALFTRATDHEELLNTQNSNFVKVRLLEQDVFVDGMSLDDDAGFVPLRILPQDDYALKAKVVEVPKKEQMIKIAPIALQNVAFKRDATGDGEVTTVVYAEGIEAKRS